MRPLWRYVVDGADSPDRKPPRLRSVDHIRCPLARARGAGADDGAGGAARARGWCATAPRFNNCVEGSVDHIRCPLARAKGAGADDGAGGAARARGWCATAPRFNNCVEARLRRAFSLGFQAGAIAVFIHWRGWQPMVRWIMPELEATAPPIPV